MKISPLVTQLVDVLRGLPGMGYKSAQRIAFYLLERNRLSASQLARALTQALERVDFCTVCRMLSETPICPLCADLKREAHTLCIVETPSDLLAIEHTGEYRGQYFVLMGHLSPLDGMGPEELAIPQLVERIEKSHIEEVILATNLTLEGDATAHYIAHTLKPYKIRMSRLAQGIPTGGELEWLDGRTLAQAFAGRREFI